jgi:hypothetical protein
MAKKTFAGGLTKKSRGLQPAGLFLYNLIAYYF